MAPIVSFAQRRGISLLTALVLVAALAACSAPTASPPTDTPAPAMPEPAVPTLAPTDPPPPPTEPEPTATPESVDVLLVASSGNLIVRRGPSVAYAIVGYMSLGQTARIVGVNAAGDWVHIERPDSPGNYGWVFRSNFASLQGSLDGLDVIVPEPPRPTYLRNCTYHPMRIMPGDFILADRNNAPDNVHQVNPGTYEAYDQSQEGNPMVFSGPVNEGQRIDIITDGLGNTYPCD